MCSSSIEQLGPALLFLTEKSDFIMIIMYHVFVAGICLVYR